MDIQEKKNDDLRSDMSLVKGFGVALSAIVVVINAFMAIVSFMSSKRKP
jgi:hypothetical protein